MARPRTIDEATILDAARELFLSEGYSVSTAAIARAAGCSEGTLFKRFGTKSRLFEAALGIPDFRLDRRVEGLSRDVGPRTNLVTLGLELVDFLRELMPRTLRLWGREGCLTAKILPPNRGPHVAIEALAGYIAAEVDRGRMGPVHPEIVARAYIGSIHFYVFAEVLGVGGPARIRMSAPTFIEGLVDSLWRGIAPAEREGVR